MEDCIQDLAVRARAGDSQALHKLMGPTYAIACDVVEGRIGKTDGHPSGGRYSAWDVPWKVVHELIVKGGIMRVGWDPRVQNWEAYVRRRAWLRLNDALSGGQRIVNASMDFDPEGSFMDMRSTASEEPEAVLLKWERYGSRRSLAAAALRLVRNRADRWAVREIYLLRRATYAQAAVSLGCSEGTLKSRLSRSFKRIASALYRSKLSDGGDQIAPAVA